MVGIPGIREQDKEFIRACDILVDGHLLPFRRPQRQEVADVLTEMQCRKQRGQDEGEDNQ